jgi:hypothetical protein
MGVFSGRGMAFQVFKERRNSRAQPEYGVPGGARSFCCDTERMNISGRLAGVNKYFLAGD